MHETEEQTQSANPNRYRDDREINALAESVAKSISEQLTEAGSYKKEVAVSVPQLTGIDPSLLQTHVWRDFSHNVQYATMNEGRSNVKYLHLMHFTLEVKDGRYTGTASGRLIDDDWSL